MVEVMGLYKSWYRGPLEWHYLPTKHHESLQSDLKVVSGGNTDTHTHTHTHTHTVRQIGDVISLLLFLESRMKRESVVGNQRTSLRHCCQVSSFIASA
jgi:hypothetical protein